MLIVHVLGNLRGKRVYSEAQIEIIANIGYFPPAGCTRSSLSSVISRVSGRICVQAN